MKKDECWMSFSEALEAYLQARESRDNYGPGRNRDRCEEEMLVARQHMDALTGDEQ